MTEISEVLTAAAGEALGGLIMKAATSVYSKVLSQSPPDLTVGPLTLFTDREGNEVLLTEEQVSIISTFSESPEALALAQTYIFASAMRRQFPYVKSWLPQIEDSFKALFRDSAPRPGRTGEGLEDLVWELLVTNIRVVAPTTGGLARLPERDLKRLLDTHDLVRPASEQPTPRYLRLIVDVTRDRSAVLRLRQLCSDICRSAYRATVEMRLDHTQEHHRFSHDDLYVTRDLMPIKDERTLPRGWFRRPQPGYGAVIIGNPGVGKSTLVTRLVNDVAKSQVHDLAPIMIKCRELSLDPGQALISAITRTLTAQVDVSCTTQSVEELLALGRAFLVFDGVDEVVDLIQRRRLIEQIEHLADAYPLLSIICTSRKVGYDAARFSGRLFSLFEIQEYSREQVQEYVGKWFSAMRRPEIDRVAFLRDSEEINDVRRNPLMLSLLCALYRIRGYIPMNRLEVYKSCAELMFYSWDAMRRIPQPIDHRRYGHTLMEELADFFLKFPSAGAGIEEKQLTGIVAGYFHDTAGVAKHEAGLRAVSFLDFCAGRAWLLTAVGHDGRGQRLFSFTHRTFMEFFAAQAAVRRSSNLYEILFLVVEEYRKNPSSAFPDLVVQAYDEKQHRGAEELLRKLLPRLSDGPVEAFYVPLLLRLLNSTPVPAKLVADIIATAFKSWTQVEGREQANGFIALLQLYRDPRQVCIGLLTGRDSIEFRHRRLARHFFITRWAMLADSGDDVQFSADWKELVDDIVGNSPEGLFQQGSEVVKCYLLSRNDIADEDLRLNIGLSLIYHFQGCDHPGPILAEFLALPFNHETIQPSELFKSFSDQIRIRPIEIKLSLAQRIGAMLVTKFTEHPADPARASHKDIEQITLWLACLLTEVSPSRYRTAISILLSWNGRAETTQVIRTRLEASNLEDDEAPAEGPALLEGAVPLSQRAVAQLDLPKWVARWMAGKVSLLAKQ